MNTTGLLIGNPGPAKYSFVDFTLKPGYGRMRKLVALMRYLAAVSGKDVRVRVRVR